MSVPDGLWQELPVQDVHALVRAHSVVQLGKVETVVEVGKVVESVVIMGKSLHTKNHVSLCFFSKERNLKHYCFGLKR